MAKSKSAAPVSGLKPDVVVSIAKRWAPGSTIRVAFNGGSPQLHRGIERAAAVWTQYANLGFDFGYDSSANRYRSWSPGDPARAAEVRIGFDAPGYWSCVGTDSMLDVCATAGQQSMNFHRFDVVLPSTWVATVLHEFGHALGLEHEHQNPKDGCDGEFLWDDEAGYVHTRDIFQQFVPDANGRRPGISTVLAGPLNHWDRDTIERNMKQLPDSNAYQSAVFDKDSVMKYEFPAWQFRTRNQSKCYSVRNDTLSTADRSGISRAYPRELVLMRNTTQLQMSAVSAVSRVADLETRDQSVLLGRIKSLAAMGIMRIK